MGKDRLFNFVFTNKAHTENSGQQEAVCSNNQLRLPDDNNRYYEMNP